MQNDLILRKEDIVRLNIILTKVIDKSRIDCGLLINKSGRLITAQSEGVEFDKTAVAALVSSTFASTNSIASIIGEKEFSSLVQEGEVHHLYVASIDENTLLACIFDKRSNFEKVKKAIEEFTPYLRESLGKIYGNTASTPEMNIDGALNNLFNISN
ncbi:MAG: roadblock/LC7 domain-containing protein [Chitinivibrionales bacterium]|nr:roadblock/LC7 domain-containing protein [Chitinivibrionales bacterium]